MLGAVHHDTSARVGAARGGYEARAYHPGSASECSLRFTDAEANQTPLHPLEWVATTMPSTLEMYIINERPRLRLGAFRLGPPKKSGFTMIDNFSPLAY